MRKEISRRFRAVVAEAMRNGLPYFDPVKPAGGNRLVYQFQPTTRLSLFICFQVDAKRDEFTVEIAWSEHNRWPVEYLPGMPRDIPALKVSRSAPKNGEFRARLSKFWELPHKDSWWEIVPNRARRASERALRQLFPDSPGEVAKDDFDVSGEQAIERISPLVNDAVAKLKEFAIPFFQEVVGQHGAAWPGTESPNAEGDDSAR